MGQARISKLGRSAGHVTRFYAPRSHSERHIMRLIVSRRRWLVDHIRELWLNGASWAYSYY